jgi:hypothetical protein
VGIEVIGLGSKRHLWFTYFQEKARKVAGKEMPCCVGRTCIEKHIFSKLSVLVVNNIQMQGGGCNVLGT